MSRRFLVAIVALFATGPWSTTYAQKKYWEEYDKLVDRSKSIVALSADDALGDSLDLYTGTLSFSTTDVSIPGNHALPVNVTRKLQIVNTEGQGFGNRVFGDWALDIPNVSSVSAGNWRNDRCNIAPPPPYYAGSGSVGSVEFWSGNNADMPGGGELLLAATVVPKPSTGETYRWMTSERTFFSCLESISNGTGQGFKAIGSDGTKYWFDHLAQYPEPPYASVSRHRNPPTIYVERKRNVLYATRIEDRFGNWVQYAYSNTFNQPLRITGITSSDGRSLSFLHNGNGHISSVSDGTRTWTYQYQNGSLSQVTLPDASKWTIQFANLSSARIAYLSSDDPKRCIAFGGPLETGDYSGSITHPSGLTGTFTVGPVVFGKTNVPKLCANYEYPGTGNSSDPADDYLIIPFRWHGLALKSKQLSGLGVTPASWSYTYTSARSWVMPPGQTVHPVCITEDCLGPICTSDACAGTTRVEVSGPGGRWDRYTFGNSHRYNEGKLLAHETGTGGQDAIKAVIHTYNFESTGQPYVLPVGTSPQSVGRGFSSEYPRPLVKTETYQDGGGFIWEVDTGCTTAGGYCLDALIRPTRVTRTGIVGSSADGGPAAPPYNKPVLTAPVSSTTGSYPLSWTAVSLATHYELRERLGTGSWSTIHNAAGTSASVSGRGSGSWSYEVRACNAGGCSAWSTSRSVLVTIAPTSAPTLTSPDSSSTGSYTVSWTSVADATYYELEQRKDGGAWVLIHDTPAVNRPIAGLTNGVYGYRARGCNSTGCGPYSAVKNTTVTLAALGQPVLTGSTSVPRGTPFGLSWTTVSGATQYVLRRNRNGGVYSIVYDGPGTSVTQTIAMLGTYTYNVTACNASGCGPASANVYVEITSSGTDSHGPDEEASQ
jgi:hypothetical protein